MAAEGKMDPMSQFEPVATHGHIHVRQEDVDGKARLEKHQGLSGVGSFDHLETGIFEKV